MIPYLHAIWTEWGGVLRIDLFIPKIDHRGKGGFLVMKGVFLMEDFQRVELRCLERCDVNVDRS